MKSKKMLAENLYSRKGFTMIELVLVLVIVAILSIVIVPRIGSVDRSSRNLMAQAEMVEIQKAIMGAPGFRGYSMDNNGNLPATLASLMGAASGYNPFLQTGNRGVYLTSTDDDQNGVADILEDPWGSLYQYNNTTGVITCWGRNKALGGGDDFTLDVNG